jgi:Uma2 family endonuclease
MSSMTTPAPARPITAEEFLHMPESDGAELLDGVIVEKNVGFESSWLESEILALLTAFLRGKRLGRALGPQAGYRLWPARPNHLRKPDVSFVSSAALGPGPLPKGWSQIRPDLVVEVVSPNDEADELERKLADYREAGIPLIWVIYPGTRAAQVLTPTTRFDVFPSGTLDGGDVLPGFALSLEELFRGLDEE